MRIACFLIMPFVLSACGSDTPDTDGGVDAADECTGTWFVCCSACDDDTVTRAVCVGGTYTCPSGTSPQSSFHCPCFGMACSLPPPRPKCLTCVDGGSVASACNEDAGEFECPAGSYDPDTTEAGVCAADASAD